MSHSDELEELWKWKAQYLNQAAVMNPKPAQMSSHVIADEPTWIQIVEPEPEEYTMMPHLYTWQCDPEFGHVNDRIMVMAETMQDAIIRARDYHKKKYPNSAPEKVKWTARRTDLLPEEAV